MAVRIAIILLLFISGCSISFITPQGDTYIINGQGDLQRVDGSEINIKGIG